MRINLEGETRNGYTNIISQMIKCDTLPEDTDLILGQYHNLDPIIKDGEATEIIFNPPLNVLPPDKIVDVLEHWNKKLAEKGRLRCGFLDIRRIGYNCYTGKLGLAELDQLIFGPQHIYRSLCDSDVFRDLAKALNFSVDSMVSKDAYVSLDLVKNAN